MRTWAGDCKGKGEDLGLGGSAVGRVKDGTELGGGS